MVEGKRPGGQGVRAKEPDTLQVMLRTSKGESVPSKAFKKESEMIRFEFYKDNFMVWEMN